MIPDGPAIFVFVGVQEGNEHYWSFTEEREGVVGREHEEAPLLSLSAKPAPWRDLKCNGGSGERGPLAGLCLLVSGEVCLTASRGMECPAVRERRRSQPWQTAS